jgi:ubiquinone/menaquinone biosynthesis C-methylase UbiE
MTAFDPLAEHYDETRGGERRGDEYAADVDAHLPAGEGPILEVGVGTGVVALGLRRRGRDVIGLDLSPPMLARARARLGTVVILADALRMPLASQSVAHAVSVWVVHAVADPVQFFAEAARVLRRGGRYVVCSTQLPDPDDVIGGIITEMGHRVDVRRRSSRPRGVTTEETIAWAGQAGFTATVHRLPRQWSSTPADELAAIRRRQWPALRELDELAIREVTQPAVDALEALPPTSLTRRASADMIVLTRP